MVVVTGGIGSGKSTLCSILSRDPLVEVIDADALVHEILRDDRSAADEIRRAFGGRVFGSDGKPDHRALADLVFQNDELLSRLEAILHPRVEEALAMRVAELKHRGGVDIVLVEVPLVAEKGRPSWADLVVVVETPDAVRLERLKAKGMSAEEVRRRMAVQASDDERRSVADILIDNSGSVGQLELLARDLLRQIRGVRAGAERRDELDGGSGRST